MASPSLSHPSRRYKSSPQHPLSFPATAYQRSGTACYSLLGSFVTGTWVPQPMARTPLLSRSPPASTGRRTPDILELVVLGDKKRSSSTSSMQRAVETSPLLHRIAHVVPTPGNALKNAIFTSRFPDVRTYHDARFLAVAFDADPAIQQSPYCKV